jgi:hypothetical protein
MKRWSEFAAERPTWPRAGRTLIYQHRVGLGYLATVRKDGGPRLHPVCPLIAHGGLYVFIGNQSPKLRDLSAIAASPSTPFRTGGGRRVLRVRPRAAIDEPAVGEVVYAAYVATGAFTSHDTLFELWLERALHARYGPRPSWPPEYTKWSSAGQPVSTVRPTERHEDFSKILPQGNSSSRSTIAGRHRRCT